MFLAYQSRMLDLKKDIRFKYQDCGRVAGLPPEKIEAIISLADGLEQLEDLEPFLQHLAGLEK